MGVEEGKTEGASRGYERNEDRPNENLPKDVLVDQREAKFVEAEDSGQERAEDGDKQVGEGINEFLIMK